MIISQEGLSTGRYDPVIQDHMVLLKEAEWIFMKFSKL